MGNELPCVLKGCGEFIFSTLDTTANLLIRRQRKTADQMQGEWKRSQGSAMWGTKMILDEICMYLGESPHLLLRASLTGLWAHPEP